MLSNLGTAWMMSGRRTCIPVANYGGIPGEEEGSESGNGPTPGVPGSRGGPGRGKRMRITCCLSWSALCHGTQDPSGWDAAAAGFLVHGSLLQPGVGPWVVRWCNYWGFPALSCGTRRSSRHVRESGLTQR